MAIVATGYGIPPNKIGPVVFGYTLKSGQAPPPVQTLIDSGINNFWVLDFRIKRRRPATAYEWRLIRDWLGVRNRAAKRARREAQLDREIARDLASQGVRVDSYTPRMVPGDWSGLIPVKHVVGNPTGQARRVGDRAPGLRATDPQGIRPGVRGQSPGGSSARAPDPEVLPAARARGRDRRHSTQRLSSRRP